MLLLLRLSVFSHLEHTAVRLYPCIKHVRRTHYAHAKYCIIIMRFRTNIETNKCVCFPNLSLGRGNGRERVKILYLGRKLNKRATAVPQLYRHHPFIRVIELIFHQVRTKYAYNMEISSEHEIINNESHIIILFWRYRLLSWYRWLSSQTHTHTHVNIITFVLCNFKKNTKMIIALGCTIQYI